MYFLSGWMTRLLIDIHRGFSKHIYSVQLEVCESVDNSECYSNSQKENSTVN